MALSRLVMLASAFAFVSFLHAAPATAQTSPDAEFKAGTSAFHRHDYQRALKHFLRAQRSGMHSIALYYNLGVTYYRLGQYRQARQAFLQAAASPAMAAPSYYNLGLVAMRERQTGAARYWFERALRSAHTPQLRQLSETMLGRLPKTRRWYAVVEGAAGYDDNAVLASSSQVIRTSQKGAAYGDLLVAGQGLLHGTWHQGLRAVAAFDARRYPRLANFNLTTYSGSLQGTHPLGAWQTRGGLGLGGIDFGGHRLESTASLTARAERPLTEDLRFDLRYRYVHIRGGSSYGYLDGWRQELRSGLHEDLGVSRWELWYAVDLNSRNDLHRGAEFYSFSPLRQTVGIRYRRPVSSHMQAVVRVSYQYSRFRGADTRNIGGTLVTRTRVDRRPEVQLALYRSLPRDWRAGVRLNYEDNSSNFASESYRRTWLELTVQRFF